LWLVRTVIAVIGAAVPRLTETQLDFGVLAVAAALSIGTALLFGIGPALALVVTNVQQVLKKGGGTVSASRRVVITGRAMVAVQVALTIVLLAGAGLMFKSIWRMTAYPAGFAPDQILTMHVDIHGPQYRDQKVRHDFAAALVSKAKTMPGVRDAAITTGRGSMMLVIKEGEGGPPPGERERRAAPVSSISPGFGPLLGMSRVSGRWLKELDSPGVAVIYESLARRDLKEPDPIAAAPAIRNALSAIDPTQSFYNIKTLEEVPSDSIAPRRFNLLLLGTFAIVALVLAALGVYGVVAYAVSERTHEIGIRMALGAERSNVVRMMVTQGMWSVGAGLVVGLFGAWAATRLIAGLLYGVQPHDAATFAVTTLALGSTACLACVVPALKAALVDPAMALRAE
jgi:hypothetical protein